MLERTSTTVVGDCWISNVSERRVATSLQLQSGALRARLLTTSVGCRNASQKTQHPAVKPLLLCGDCSYGSRYCAEV